MAEGPQGTRLSQNAWPFELQGTPKSSSSISVPFWSVFLIGPLETIGRTRSANGLVPPTGAGPEDPSVVAWPWYESENDSE